jgi:uncharacterized protein (DUF3084 family)
MRGAVIYGPRDVRFEEREDPKIIEPTDAIIRISATCVCGSDLWPYRGIEPLSQPTPMGHEYCGIVEEVGSAVTTIKPGQFVVVPNPARRAQRIRPVMGRRGIINGATVPACRSALKTIGIEASASRTRRSRGGIAGTSSPSDAARIPCKVAAHMWSRKLIQQRKPGG